MRNEIDKFSSRPDHSVLDKVQEKWLHITYNVYFENVKIMVSCE